MPRVFPVLLAGLALLGTASAAQAVVITTPTQTITFAQTPTDWDQSGTIQLFDRSLGTLLSVSLSARFAESSTVTVSNSPSALKASTGSARTELILQLSSDVSGITDAIQSVLGSGTPDTLDLLGTKFFYSRLAAGASASGPSNGSIASGIVLDTDPAHLAAFEAAGPVFATIFASTNTLTVLSNTGGNASASQVTSASGNFTVAYTYRQAVPEPGSIVLVGVGLVGAGFIRRRGSR